MKSNFAPHIFKKFLTIIDVSPHEWPRVLYLFGLTILTAVGHVIGHAVLLGSVTRDFGVQSIPVALILFAVGSMISTMVFTRIIAQSKRKKLFSLFAFIAGVLLFFGYAYGENLWILYASMFGALAIFHTQIHTLLALLKEHNFTPFESQRVFPVIESSELFAGIVWGGLISLLSGQFFDLGFHLQVNDFLLLWGGFLIASLVLEGIYAFIRSLSPTLETPHKHKEVVGVFESFQKTSEYFQKYKMLRYLAGLVFFQFFVYQLFEFLYALSLSSHSSGHGGEAVLHGLGFIALITSFVGIVLQIFVAPHIARHFGVVWNLLVNPVVSLPMGMAMLATMNSGAIMTSKAVFDISKHVSKNAYLTSLYGIPEQVRKFSKPYLDGFIGQLGIISATALLILIEVFWHHYAALGTAISIVIGLFVLLVLLLFMKRVFTGSISAHLKNTSFSEEEHFAFVELLGQKGHTNAAEIFIQILRHRPNINPLLKKKILQTVGELGDPGMLPFLLDMLEKYKEDPSAKEEKIIILRTINKLRLSKTHFLAQSFSRHRSIELLKDMYLRESSKQIKTEIIRYFAKINETTLVPFLLQSLDIETEGDLADNIAALGFCDDPTIATYVRQFLKSEAPKVRSNTIIVMWQFRTFRKELIGHITKLLAAKEDNKEALLSSLYMIGEMKLMQDKDKLWQQLEGSEDYEVRKYAAVSLLKLGQFSVVDEILQHLLHNDKDFALHTKKMVSQVPSDDIRHKIHKLLSHKVHKYIFDILKSYEHDLAKIPEDSLYYLRHYFALIEKDKEIHTIEKEMERRQKNI